MSAFLDAALGYASVGFHVFPLRAGSKLPATAHGKDDATRDEATIRSWWSADPNFNVAIATAPSQIAVLDVDTAGDKPGMASLAQWQLEHGQLPPTLTARSARGGLHKVYARPADAEPHTRLSFRPALDLIANGYCAVFPSVFEGGQYTWIDAAPIAPLPPALVEVMRGGGGSGSGAGSTIIGSGLRPGMDEAALHQAALTLAGAWPRSGRHQAQLALAGALAGEGWQPEEIAQFAAAVARLEPGREAGYDGEIAKRLTAARTSVAKREAGEPALGWGTLQQALGAGGERVISDVTAKLGIGVAERAFRDAVVAQAQHDLPVYLRPAVATTAPRPWKLLEEICEEPLIPVHRCETGYAELDRLTGGGLATKQLILLIAPPGSFKTSFALDLLMRLERPANGSLGRPGLYVGTEIDDDQVFARASVIDQDLAWRDVTTGRIARSSLMSAVRGRRIAVLGPDALPRDEDLGPLFNLLGQTVQELIDLYGTPPAVVFDYLQQAVRTSEETRRAKLSVLTYGLMRLARHFNLPLIGVSSTGRETYSALKREAMRKAKDPNVYLGAGKESGDLEYDAATVMYMDVEKLAKADDGTIPAILAMSKCRDGESGLVGLRVTPHSGSWREDTGAVEAVVACESGGAAKTMKAIAKAGKLVAQTAGSDAADDDQVVLKARQLPLPRNQMREVTGLSVKRADAAITRCLGDGRLVLEKRSEYDKHGRTHTTIYVTAPPPPAPPLVQLPAAVPA